MTCCPHCTDAEGFFTDRTARRDLRRYRRKGPTGTTDHLLRMLRSEGIDDGTLLDIGGGIGVLQHELLQAGLSRALHVDASTGYLEASKEEAARRGHRERVEYVHGDFVELADDLPAADVVTLDRVVCCYPDMPRLVEVSAARAGRLYGLSYPRDRWGVRAGLAFANLWFRLRGSSFRTFLHPPDAIDAEIQRHGLRRVAEAKSFVWQVALYRRVTDQG